MNFDDPKFGGHFGPPRSARSENVPQPHAPGIHVPSVLHVARMVHAAGHALIGTPGAAETAKKLAANPPANFDPRALTAVGDALAAHARAMGGYGK